MSNELELSARSPFESFKKSDQIGDCWDAREIRELYGYDTWEKFENTIERARIAIKNAGQDPDVHASQRREAVTEGSSPRTRGNYRLTRYGAYMVAINGDPRKPEIAEAQSYFAEKTRQAEMGLSAVPKDYPTALRLYADLLEEEAKLKEMVALQRERVQELEPKAEEYDAFIDADGNYSWNAVAKILYKDESPMGRNLLLRKLRELNVVLPPKKNERALPKQTYQDNGWFKVKLRKPYTTNTTYVTPLGVSEVYKLLKDSGEDVAEPFSE